MMSPSLILIGVQTGLFIIYLVPHALVVLAPIRLTHPAPSVFYVELLPLVPASVGFHSLRAIAAFAHITADSSSVSAKDNSRLGGQSVTRSAANDFACARICSYF